MTVQDFIVNYSETFQYLHDRFGKEAVVDLWRELGAANGKLAQMVREKGLPGYLEYFYGDQGTCCREHLVGGASIDENGLYVERVACCPSVSELEARGKRPYRYYCEHCYWLYNRALEDNGFNYDVDYKLQPQNGGYAKTCVCYAHQREGEK